MPNTVKRFDKKETYSGRDVKRTIVRHARTESTGRKARPGREMKKNVR